MHVPVERHCGMGVLMKTMHVAMGDAGCRAAGRRQGGAFMRHGRREGPCIGQTGKDGQEEGRGWAVPLPCDSLAFHSICRASSLSCHSRPWYNRLVALPCQLCCPDSHADTVPVAAAAVVGHRCPLQYVEGGRDSALESCHRGRVC